jgi:hypothetical protein
MLRFRLGPNNSSLPVDELLTKIISHLAEYIQTQLHDQLSSPLSTETIIKELHEKLDDSGLNFSFDNLDHIYGTLRLLFKNLPIIIQSTIFTADHVSAYRRGEGGGLKLIFSSFVH